MSEFNVVVLGPRGTGKSTLLSLIVGEMQKDLLEHDCVLNLAPQDEELFNEADLNLKKMLSSTHDIEHDIESTSNIKTYKVSIENKNVKTKSWVINFKDHPGGYFDKTLEKQLLKSYKDASLVLYVFDAPYLMEASGIYNEKRNFKDSLLTLISDIENNKSKKTIIFMPLKCEKYDESILKTTFEHEYSDVIAECERNENINHTLIAVETIGGVVFKKFGELENEEFPKAIFTRKYPNSPLEVKNINKITRTIIKEFMEIQSQNYKFLSKQPTKNATLAQEIVKNIERVI